MTILKRPCLARTAGDNATAEHHYSIALAIREHLAATDPSNPGYQRDLNVFRDRFAQLAKPDDGGPGLNEGD